jgi:hypothetical protein
MTSPCPLWIDSKRFLVNGAGATVLLVPAFGSAAEEERAGFRLPVQRTPRLRCFVPPAIIF